MSIATSGISHCRIAETPIAIVDFETTGLSAGSDRVVEVAVVRVEPGKEPVVTLDTLVNPVRRVSATEIHGIRDEDVIGAPKFSEIAGEVVGCLEGCVVTAYNVYFDLKFLNFELANAGVDHEPPHFCLMYMRPMLGLGSRCKLAEACKSHSISYENEPHVAVNDAMACSRLLKSYLGVMSDRGIKTFGELARLKTYKFCDSFERGPMPHPTKFKLGPFDRLVSRNGRIHSSVVDPMRRAMAAYWDTLRMLLADLEITEEEIASAQRERESLGLTAEHVRSIHARAFANAIGQVTEDRKIDDREARKLRKLYVCLGRLGWAPGE